MTLKTLKLTSILLGVMSYSPLALEPKEDRAQVQSLYATLLLPDGSNLNTDINFDCGSRFKNTGIIITTDEGAQFLANAYKALYGEKASNAVLKAWNTKANPDDPRKPTMLLINSFPANDNNLSNKGNAKFNKKLQGKGDSVSIRETDRTLEAGFAPPIIQLCGARVHENYQY